ncbi:MAG: hypothetical protein IKK67_06115 [Bacteroidaceae bacterium]|nr:hypothetical protein [Bacteroidaceae bacterium]
MKKKILSATFVVAMMAVAGYNVYMSQAKADMSELALANLEALAGVENGPSYTGLRVYSAENGDTCLNCPEPEDMNCKCIRY